MGWSCIPCTYSQEPEEESSETYSLGTLQSELSKLKSIPDEFCCKDNLTGFFRSFPFGTTLRRSAPTTQKPQDSLPEQRRCQGNSSYAAGSRSCAKTLVLQGEVQGWRAKGRGSGRKWRGWSAKLDLDTSSWKIAQCLPDEDLTSCLWTWPSWGMMRDGVCTPLPTPVLHTCGNGSGLWPTPTASEEVQAKRLGGCQEVYIDTTGKPRRRMPTGGSASMGLGKMAATGMWPTPTASAGGPEPEGRTGRKLATVVAKWPTLTAQDAKNNGSPSQMQRNSLPLNAKVKMLPTPRSEDSQCAGGHRGRDDTLYGMVCKPKSGKTGSPGQLNPTWVELLMGWPENWTCLDPLQCRWNGQETWPEDWEDGVPRIATGVKDRVSRLKAIGNGQVPAVAALAWRELSRSSTVPYRPLDLFSWNP